MCVCPARRGLRFGRVWVVEVVIDHAEQFFWNRQPMVTRPGSLKTESSVCQSS